MSVVMNMAMGMASLDMMSSAVMAMTVMVMAVMVELNLPDYHA